MKKKYQTITIILITILLITYILNSNLIVKNILDYTELFLTKLFPTSFIIYILSSILIDYGIINYLSKLKLNGTIAYVSIMSFISGFPSGAKYTKELLDKNLISKETANYLITYTNFPNPIFLLGPISTILTKELALKLLITITLSNFIISIIFKSKQKNYQYQEKIIQTNFSTSLKNATNNAIKTLLIVYSSSLFFYLISVIINKYVTLTPVNYVILNSFFDLTKGIFSTPIISNITTRALIILLLLSLGSISIHIQVKSIISDTSIKYKNYLSGRIIQLIISIPIFLVIK